MTGFRLVALFAGAFAIGLAGVSSAGELKIARWPYMAPINMKNIGEKKVVECALTPEVYDTARPDLADLRVGGENGAETGYLLRRAEGSVQKIPITVTLYNRSYVPGKQSSITADFGSKIIKNRVGVKTPGTNFRRKVRVEASDDGESWVSIGRDSYLFRVGGGGGSDGAYDKQLVTIPENNLRYLRITVFRGDDDPDVVEIEDVKASRQVKTAAETVPVPIVSAKAETKKHTTDILLDLGFKNLPLYNVELDFSDGDFFRNVTVEGRNRETRIVRTPVEDSPALEKTVKEPWNRVTAGRIYRFSGGDSVEESLRVNLKGARYRYLMIRVRNDDNPPLHFTSARVERLVGRIAFPSKTGARFALYLGNAKARKPGYDVGHYLDRMRGQGVYEAALGEVEHNPRYTKVEKPIPWSERHKGIIWVALLAMLAALGLLVYRIAASARKTGT